jgi:two-component system CheB/CheR fusion protein
MAYVIVQHLDPSHESLLPEILARAASIPVLEVLDGVQIEADHAYVIPPNTTMTVTDGHLQLVARRRGPHSPIDEFLRSLADTHDSGAIGVILSGAGTDGAHGIEAIKARGGITMAQDSASARFPSMPERAAATGHVDFVLPPEELADKLAAVGRQLGGRPSAEAPDAGDLQKILVLLRNRTGVDFQHYRDGTVGRRILRRIVLHRLETRKEYVSLLRSNPEEVDALFDELLIGVTRFFRDPATFDVLQESAFPAMMSDRPLDAPLRVWVAGCAGGEEAYSIAIALLEFLGERAAEVPTQLFATDLSEAAIAKARAGFYPFTIEADVSPERLRRFFVKEDTGYRIAKVARDLCIFSRQNLVRDPPFSQLDLVSCRNVLIYLTSPLQARVFPTFHYALKPNGILLLGNAESVGAAGAELFVPLDKKHRIYRRRPVATRRLDVQLVPSGHTGPRPAPRVTFTAPPYTDDVQRAADRVILDGMALSGVVVDEHREIVQFRGDTTRYLQHAPGTASLDLLRLVRPDLLAAVRVAIQAAIAEERPSRERHIAVHDGEHIRYVSVAVFPFRPTASAARFFAVLFRDERNVAERKPRARSRAHSGEVQDLRREMQDLRGELERTKRHLQEIIESNEAANEEIRAANEEVQSSNEELQSTNEELETTKEEIQSTNEELMTVNDELRHRNRELAALSGDLTNVLASTQIPIVIVDSDLRVRRFTPATEQVMRVIPGDMGRPLSDLKLRVDIPDLEARIVHTIDSLATTEEDVRDDQGHWWSFSIRPYRTVDHVIDGAVLIFTNIDAVKRYGEEATQARDSADQAKRVAEDANTSKTTFLAGMSHDLRTPLNAIVGYVELLQMQMHGPVNDQQQVDLRRIKQSAAHLVALVTDILNFARINAGALTLQLSDVELSPLIGEIEELVLPQVQAKSITFARGQSDGVAHADPDRIRQILLNLIGNAIKFTSPGGHIDVSASSGDDTVRLSVSDTGIGIARDQFERIFQPFVQISRGLTSVGIDGVGLGLAVSRDLARRMGGDVRVESTVGEGSCFSLSLPKGDGDQSRSPRNSPTGASDSM